ncbi:MAG: hypothetical protein D6746_09040 [Bacteroidetes bacterium]|nr:MAG: hypothetical protein D6746_09040 [Bacteroidota bacterium]
MPIWNKWIAVRPEGFLIKGKEFRFAFIDEPVLSLVRREDVAVETFVRRAADGPDPRFRFSSREDGKVYGIVTLVTPPFGLLPEDEVHSLDFNDKGYSLVTFVAKAKWVSRGGHVSDIRVLVTRKEYHAI